MYPISQTTITVASVPDVPEVVLPARSSVNEDGIVVVHGMGAYDADVSRLGKNELLFEFSLEATSGRLSLNGSVVRTLR